MAQNNCKDEEWDYMLDIAQTKQQDWYELLPEWTIYGTRDLPFLKMNIGFAMFGPPSQEPSKENKTSNTVSDKKNDQDLSQIFEYPEEQQLIIDKLYDKICEYGKGYIHEETICYGVIYNVIFRNKKAVTAECNSKQSEASNKDKKTAKKEDPDPALKLNMTPIFKIRRSVNKDTPNTHAITCYETWYLDQRGRIYKTWQDYKENNTLPECTMVLPKHGFYQPDPRYEITESESVVWVEVEDSPASTISATLLGAADTASSVIGLAGMGVGIASLFTPVGPLVLGAGLLATGVNGLWTVGRSAQNLVDRSLHEESISVTDREALGSWLGVAGGTVGIAATGGTILLTRAAQTGTQVGTAAKLLYNGVVLSNLGINGVGIAYQGYCMYEKYQEQQTIDTYDVVLLGTHILFFGNAVLNFQFASDLIKSTQGKILDEYQSGLRTKRLRKAFNRARRTAVVNNTDPISENAEVIRYINNKKNFSQGTQSGGVTTSESFKVKFQDGRITVNDIVLMDPREFVLRLMAFGISDECFGRNASSSNRTNNDNTHDGTFRKLKNMMLELLNDFFANNTSHIAKNMPNINDFEQSLQEMKHEANPEYILSTIFTIAVILIQRCESLKEYLPQLVRFLWKYAKAHLKQAASFCRGSERNNLLQKIVSAILEVLDSIITELLSAFEYVRESHRI